MEADHNPKHLFLHDVFGYCGGSRCENGKSIMLILREWINSRLGVGVIDILLAMIFHEYAHSFDLYQTSRYLPSDTDRLRLCHIYKVAYKIKETGASK